MAASWTKAAKVRRSFKAGRRLVKERIVTPIVAIHEACILLDELREAMHEVGLPKDDVWAAIAVVTPERPDKENEVYVLEVPPPRRLPELFERMAKIEKPGKVLPLGILIAQRDREAKDPKEQGASWVQPFLVGPRAEKALILARKLFTEGKNRASFN